MAQITRGKGIHPGIPWAGPLPGGGYEGATKALDNAVKQAAEWLADHLKCDIEIRFNSHRESGGAYTKSGFNEPCAGIGAGFWVKGRKFIKPRFKVVADKCFLKPGAIVPRGADIGKCVCLDFRNLQDATEWFSANIAGL